MSKILQQSKQIIRLNSGHNIPLKGLGLFNNTRSNIDL